MVDRATKAALAQVPGMANRAQRCPDLRNTLPSLMPRLTIVGSRRYVVFLIGVKVFDSTFQAEMIGALRDYQPRHVFFYFFKETDQLTPYRDVYA